MILLKRDVFETNRRASGLRWFGTLSQNANDEAGFGKQFDFELVDYHVLTLTSWWKQYPLSRTWR